MQRLPLLLSAFGNALNLTAVGVLGFIAVSCTTLPPTLESGALAHTRDERATLNCLRGAHREPLVVLWIHTPESSSLAAVDGLGITRFRATLTDSQHSISGPAQKRDVRELLVFYQLLRWPRTTWQRALENSGWQFQRQSGTTSLHRRGAVWRVSEHDGDVEFARTVHGRILVTCSGRILPKRT